MDERDGHFENPFHPRSLARPVPSPNLFEATTVTHFNYLSRRVRSRSFVRSQYIYFARRDGSANGLPFSAAPSLPRSPHNITYPAAFIAATASYTDALPHPTQNEFSTLNAAGPRPFELRFAFCTQVHILHVALASDQQWIWRQGLGAACCCRV